MSIGYEIMGVIMGFVNLKGIVFVENVGLVMVVDFNG